MADLIWFLLLHCFIGIMIWLISSIAPLFYCNFDSAEFFYFTCFTAIMIRLVLFDFYHTTVLLQIWFRSSLLSHHCFIAIMIWLISSVAPLFYCNYDWLISTMALLFCYNFCLANFSYCTTVLLELWFAWFLVLHHCFIANMSWLISSITPSLNCIFYFADFFYSTTVFIAIMI